MSVGYAESRMNLIVAIENELAIMEDAAMTIAERNANDRCDLRRLLTNPRPSRACGSAPAEIGAIMRRVRTLRAARRDAIYAD